MTIRFGWGAILLVLFFIWWWPRHEEEKRRRDAASAVLIPYREEPCDRVLTAMLTYPNPVLFSPQNPDNQDFLLQAWGGEVGDCFEGEAFYEFMASGVADRYLKLCSENLSRMELIGLECSTGELRASVQINAMDPVTAVFGVEYAEDNLLRSLTVKDDRKLVEAIAGAEEKKE